MFGDLLGSALALLSQPAGAAAAGSMAGSAFNNVLAGFNQRAARKWEEDMYNKYNSPSALVRQYSDAGLNPALMFGGSTPAAPTDTSAAPVAENPLGSLPDLLGQLMELKLLDSRANNLDADTRGKNAGASLTEAQDAVYREFGRREADAKLRNLDAATRELNSRNALNKVVADLRKVEKENLSFEQVEKRWRKEFIEDFHMSPELAGEIISGIAGVVGSGIGNVVTMLTKGRATVSETITETPKGVTRSVTRTAPEGK